MQNNLHSRVGKHFMLSDSDYSSGTHKKEALIFFGSPKKNGHTSIILNKLTSNLKNQYMFSKINAYDNYINPCIDCGICLSEQNCIFNDFDYIHSKLTSAELIVVATPVYNLSFPAPLKAIFDRMQRYFCSRLKSNVKPTFNIQKKAIIILTQGSDNPFGINVISEQLKLIFSTIDTKISSKIIWTCTDFSPIPKDIDMQVKKAIINLKNDSI